MKRKKRKKRKKKKKHFAIERLLGRRTIRRGLEYFVER